MVNRETVVFKLRDKDYIMDLIHDFGFSIRGLARLSNRQISERTIRRNLGEGFASGRTIRIICDIMTIDPSDLIEPTPVIAKKELTKSEALHKILGIEIQDIPHYICVASGYVCSNKCPAYDFDSDNNADCRKQLERWLQKGSGLYA